MSPLRRVKVTERDLRGRFNDLGYWERVQAGDFRAVLREESHPAPQDSGQPYCSRSQIIAYRDESGDDVALVHQYLRPDGTLGASGRPDPKEVYYDGTLYYVERTRGRGRLLGARRSVGQRPHHA